MSDPKKSNDDEVGHRLSEAYFMTFNHNNRSFTDPKLHVASIAAAVSAFIRTNFAADQAEGLYMKLAQGFAQERGADPRHVHKGGHA
ncbi:MAG: hypothetical protein ACK4Q4_00600 [Rhodocyclaceae bacterium]